MSGRSLSDGRMRARVLRTLFTCFKCLARLSHDFTVLIEPLPSPAAKEAVKYNEILLHGRPPMFSAASIASSSGIASPMRQRSNTAERVRAATGTRVPLIRIKAANTARL